MKSRAAVLVALAVALLGAGIGLDRLVNDDAAERATLREQVDDLTSREQLLTAERDRLQAERDQLEARLAAGAAPPVCPTQYVSTALASLPAPFTFDYPCSWHVLQDAVERIEGPERQGLQVSITLVSQFPIALVAREGPLADIELADWSSQGEADDMPSIAKWIEDERARFEAPPAEQHFEGGAGLTIARLAGTRIVAETSVRVVVLIWEYIDPLSGARHIVQATAVKPGKRVRAALDRIARSFAVREDEV